jgi:hypothetical protein
MVRVFVDFFCLFSSLFISEQCNKQSLTKNIFSFSLLGICSAVKCAAVRIHTWHPMSLALGAMEMARVLIALLLLVTPYLRASTLLRGARTIEVTTRTTIVVEDEAKEDGVTDEIGLSPLEEKDALQEADAAWVGREETRVVISPVSSTRQLVVAVDRLKGACPIRIEFLDPVVQAIGRRTDPVRGAILSMIVIELRGGVVH